jgi:hypothetical protein
VAYHSQPSCPEMADVVVRGRIDVNFASRLEKITGTSTVFAQTSRQEPSAMWARGAYASGFVPHSVVTGPWGTRKWSVAPSLDQPTSTFTAS